MVVLIRKRRGEKKLHLLKEADRTSFPLSFVCVFYSERLCMFVLSEDEIDAVLRSENTEKERGGGGGRQTDRQTDRDRDRELLHKLKDTLMQFHSLHHLFVYYLSAKSDFSPYLCVLRY